MISIQVADWTYYHPRSKCLQIGTLQISDCLIKFHMIRFYHKESAALFGLSIKLGVQSTPPVPFVY